MPYLSLPFSLARNNGEAVTNATEIDVTTEGGQTIALSELIATLLSPIFQFVDNLPTASATTMGKIYIVPKDSGSEEEQNIRDEFITLDNGASTSPRYLWEHIGDLAVDLSGYATTEAMNAAIASALASYVTTTVMNAALANKQDIISDLEAIRSGASSGATAYQKPQAGIPKTDLADTVQTSLGKADTALQEHQDISGKVDKVTGKGLSTNDYTDADKAIVDGVTTALNGKVDKVTGKVLSTNDYTDADKNKLADIAAGAEVNVQPDWNQTDNTKDDYIKNKPTSLPASDVSAWAKASAKPSYTASEVNLSTPISGITASTVQEALAAIIGLGVAGQWHLGTEINTDNSTTSVTGAKLGDLYLNTDTTHTSFGNVYQLTDVSGTNKWVKKLNIIARVDLRVIDAEDSLDGYKHAYLDITNGGVQTLGTDDLMAPANAVLQAINDIMNPNVNNE